jgi:hypothetical protein
VEFAVAGIEDIKWSSLPFNCLTIPDKQREAVLALAEARALAEANAELLGVAFDNFVKGKGQGLVVLLQYCSPSYFDYDMLTCI